MRCADAGGHTPGMEERALCAKGLPKLILPSATVVIAIFPVKTAPKGRPGIPTEAESFNPIHWNYCSKGVAALEMIWINFAGG